MFFFRCLQKCVWFCCVWGGLCLLQACSKENINEGNKDNDFDLSNMVRHWADDMVIPSYEHFVQHTEALTQRAEDFKKTPSLTHLQSLKEAFRTTYIDFQKVYLFELGHAMDIRFRSYLNTYPANADKIKKNMNKLESEVDLTNEKLRDQQGLPALDFLINGLESTEDKTVDTFSTYPSYRAYLLRICRRIESLSKEVLNDWKKEYRQTFIDHPKASFNAFANAFIMQYEKYLRAGKIGIPAGYFSLTPLPQHLEAYYDTTLPKRLLQTSLKRFQEVFNGDISADGSGKGNSFKQYLDYLNSKTRNDQKPLSEAINEQFEKTFLAINALDNHFAHQITTQPQTIRNVYDALQQNVILFKIDMTQRLSIIIDYQDADGD